MVNSESQKSLVVSSFDRARIPSLIAQFLPVEICIYYQVVPISTDLNTLVLGMVDAEDLAALDYVGKMLGYSALKIHPYPLSFQQHQDLIAYYFSHPPDPAEVTALKEAAQANQLSKAHPIPQQEESEEQSPEPAPPPPASVAKDSPEIKESDETVQQLLNSMLRRALEEKAEQIFIEPGEVNSCRVRYRQQGILRDMFKELSDGVRAKLMMHLKKMVSLDPHLVGETQASEVERVYRGESLVLQLKVVPQRSKEGAILNILRGDSLVKYQQSQNNLRVSETLAIAQQTQQMMQQLQAVMGSTLEKIKQYSGRPTVEWYTLAETLEALRNHALVMGAYQQDWNNLQVNSTHSGSGKVPPS